MTYYITKINSKHGLLKKQGATLKKEGQRPSQSADNVSTIDKSRIGRALLARK